VMLCTGLIGCMPWEKSKDTKNTKLPQLPGTPKIDPAANGAAAKTWSGNGQPTGPVQQPGFATSGNSGGFRPGITGVHTNANANMNTSTANQYGNWPPQPGNPGPISTPALTGVAPSVQPAGGPVGAAPRQDNNVVGAGYTPPPPDLGVGPLPPPPLEGATGSGGTAGVVTPPVPAPTGGPLAPIAPSSTPPSAAPTVPTKGTY